jgi:DNA-binding SARP family transcriptional activator/ABC-type oligopeptide transport system substrate-binding subunit/outer membrane protein assembly factor BamB
LLGGRRKGGGLEFRILGPLQVLDEGRVLPLGGAKQRSTLAMLLLGRNRVVSRDQLIDGLWGASPPPSAGPTLDTYISRLRRGLQDDGHSVRLVTQPPGYRLRVEAGELDLERFETLLDQARTADAAGDPEATGSELRKALSLFHGVPLEDLVHAPFAQAEIRRLEALRLDALVQRLEADLAVGRHAELVGELESLAAQYPFREVLWGQLMLALYRSGRQAEALLAFDRARRTLAEELGVDPGAPLKQLHRQIVQQDPSLDRASASRASAAVATSTATPPPAGQTRPRLRRRRFLPRSRPVAVAVVLSLAVTVLASFAPRLVGGGGDARITTYRPETVLVELGSGTQIASIPRSRLAMAAYPIFAGGHFWVNNWSPLAYVEIDAKTGAILHEISPPARDPKAHRDPSTVTPFAVAGNTLWVSSADDLVKMDIELGREVDRFELDDLGKGTGVAEGVAVGGGSVWVSRSVGRGQILRLDPVTGRPEHVWDNVTPYLNLAYGDGFLWVADERGIARLDPRTNLLTPVTGIQGNCGGGGGGCVVAGGGSGWTSHESRGAVYKVDRAGHIAATYPIGIGARFMSFSDGVLWVANYDEGTVTGIDAVTGKLTTTYRFGHPVGPMAVGDGILLVQLDPGRPIEDRINSLAGKVAKFFAHPGELGGQEPALNTDPGAYQIESATCAKLLNYPDEPPPEGWHLQPEIAATMPTISPDRRTYRFTIRPGYRFSPPSNQPVTAETFRYSIERALSPKLAVNPIGQIPPGPQFIDDIAGERAFRAGRARHISGLRAAGNTLSITLTQPSPDFLHRLALPFFCPVPTGTALVFGALRQHTAGGEGYEVSAGPYYVADASGEGHIILRRNPNYPGPRRQTFDAIAIREKGDASAALDRIQNKGWDGITSMFDPALEPGGPVDRRWGAEGSAAPDEQRYFLTPQGATRFIAFNGSRGIFTDARVRRAAALAIDRNALAAAWAALPTDQLLSPALPQYRDRELYPRSASVARARALMKGRSGDALMAIPSGCDQCREAAHVARRNLATVGIDITIRKLDDLGAAIESGAKFDLLDTSTALPYPDSASFLARMVEDIPSGWVPAGVRARVEGIAGMSGNRRQAAAASVADRLATEEVPVAAYGTPQTSQFISPRIGCRVLSPFANGLHLAAACINASSR